MEIDVTGFFTGCEPETLSASVAEIGPEAGSITWRNSLAAARANDPRLISSPEVREAFNDWVVGFGAWSGDEIAAWSDDEAEALLCQFIAGSMRGAGLSRDASPEDWAEYEASDNAGELYRGDDGRVYFYLGH